MKVPIKLRGQILDATYYRFNICTRNTLIYKGGSNLQKAVTQTEKIERIHYLGFRFTDICTPKQKLTIQICHLIFRLNTVILNID